MINIVSSLDTEKAKVLEEYFYDNFGVSNNESSVFFKAETETEAEELESVLNNFITQKNEEENKRLNQIGKNLNGSALPLSKVEGKKVILDQKVVNALDITGDFHEVYVLSWGFSSAMHARANQPKNN